MRRSTHPFCTLISTASRGDAGAAGDDGAGRAVEQCVPDYPRFFFCLYDIDMFDGGAVMHGLRSHPRVYVNGVLIGNPHYQAE